MFAGAHTDVHTMEHGAHFAAAGGCAPLFLLKEIRAEQALASKKAGGGVGAFSRRGIEFTGD